MRPGVHQCAVRRAQPQPHGNFGGEVALLRERLGALGALGSAYVLGDALNGLQWHVFVADAGAAAGAPPPPVYTLEICMTHLCPAKVRGGGLPGAARCRPVLLQQRGTHVLAARRAACAARCVLPVAAWCCLNCNRCVRGQAWCGGANLAWAVRRCADP